VHLQCAVVNFYTREQSQGFTNIQVANCEHIASRLFPSRDPVGLAFLTCLVISLLTTILGPIVPDIISSFRVSLTPAGFLAFALFIAHGVISIRAGLR
jgi:hypothetical protein